MRSMLAHRPARPRSLADLLEAWVDAGLITDEQSRSIRRHEAGLPAGRGWPASSSEPGPSMVVEALGYVGGVVLLVGVTILVSLYWADLAVAARLVLVATAAVALICAGFAVPDHLGAAAERLRSVLWAAGVGATGGFMAVVSTDVLHRYDEHALVVVGIGTAAVASALWWLRRTWLQQLALFVPLMLAAVGIGMELTSPDSAWAGAIMWGVAVGWTGLAWTGRVEPQGTGVAFGALGAVLGAMTMSNDAGIALGLLTAVAVVALAIWQRSLLWLGVGAVALLWTMPRAASEWFPGPLSAALTFVIAGCLLVGADVWVARRRGSDRPRDRRPSERAR